LYRMVISPEREEKTHLAAPVRPKQWKTLDKWHRIFGHMDARAVLTLKRKGMVTGLEIDESEPTHEQCKTCVEAKQHVEPFPKKSLTEVKEIGDLTVSDVWGPARTAAIGGQLYYVSFTD
ncbi:uncharacterized protein B0H18DRAFT_842825, partial [Fomitopsis serialis]|uniref:uncharacterized protein n=1 Tax=Fomitopsis serialis TaxID=139415 RepID=UPI002007C7BF